MKWKIIADSGCDYRSLDNLAPDTEFVSVPLTIQVGETIYRDDAQLNIDQMMEEMYATTTASKSACPSPDDYMKSFEGADNIIVVTITGTLSGSYNSAEIAKKIYLEEHPDTKIHVIDSLSAGGEVDLLVRKLNHLVAEGLEFDQVLDAITAYQAKTKLLGEASKTGTLELLQKARGQKKAIKAAFDELIKAGYTGGHITIAHRNNDKFIEQFSELVREKFAHASIETLPTSGLCSFYAEEGGLLMGYEI